MNPVYAVFVHVVWFLSTYYIVVFLLVLLTRTEKLHEKRSFQGKYPEVSVIVPAYNEERKIGHTIKSLKKLNYPNIEFIVVNDGSKDDTSDVVRKSIGGDRRFLFLDNKKNKGKAASLNQGIDNAKGEFIACMDADSVVEPDVFQKTLPYFKDKKTGAVTITVEVKKPKGLLERMIDLEFILGLSLFLKALSFLDSVFVTPGPFSVYRTSVLREINGFDPDNITEDTEIAYRIHKHGYKIENCMNARVHTILPKTFKGICTQRKRWYSGALQTIIKHRSMFFKKRYGVFSYFTPFNYLLISMGLVLFFVSTYLGISKLIKNLIPFRYTGFNFFDRLFDIDIDLLTINRLTIVGYSCFIFSLVVMFAGVILTKQSIAKKKYGLIGFPLMFFLYQYFWTISIIAVMRGKKIKWR
ncbi:glycosyltransferase family 2 protein [Candidatus Woesearchaeota archaeon]|nr:glycosyltransferase family 2 protein [Candidatus Woesearchaeota archaeon]